MASLFPRVAARALASGTLAAAAVSVIASIAARREAGSAPAALNATSHFAWGDEAAAKDGYSLKYTGTGAAANYGASVFWASLYELLGLRGPRTRTGALRDAALVSAIAYVTDYHLVPRRLTPGFELRLGARALAGIYAALALGLAARDLYANSRARLSRRTAGRISTA